MQNALTKKNIDSFIEWSSSKYNEYTKEELVDTIYNAFIEGNGKEFRVSYGSWTENKIYGHCCQGSYIINPVERKIIQEYTGREIIFEYSKKLTVKKVKRYFVKGPLKYKKEKRTWYKEKIKTDHWRNIDSTQITAVTHNGKWIKCGSEESVILKNDNELTEVDLLLLTSIRIDCVLTFETE